MEDIVITGAGMVSSLGNTAEETYDALLSGKRGIRPITRFDARGFDCQVGAQVHRLDPSELGIHPKDARIMDIPAHMLKKCAHDAFMESGLDRTSISGEDIGFFVGMGMVDYEIGDLMPSVIKSTDRYGKLDYERFFTEGYREIYPLWPLSMLSNVSFCQVATSLGIRGENAVFSPHADAGAQAIEEGVRAIIDQKAAVALVGGVSEKISPLSLARGQYLKILNTSETPHKTTCRPFSRDRKGTVLGEGCGIIVLESHASARKRGARFAARVSGYGSACEREEAEKGSPTARAIASAMNEAIIAAGIEPSDIDLVIAHGDGTFAGDGNEIKAINGVFSKTAEKTDVFSSKGALGNLFAASPAIDALLAVQMIKKEMIPATLNSDPAEGRVRFNMVRGKMLSKPLKRVLINSNSHEGPCASLIIEACNS